MTKINHQQTRQLAKEVIQEESAAILALKDRIDDQFIKACETLVDVNGRIVVIGIGKSGHVGRKIAATLASTGSPAFFISAAEASHGDLGMVCSDDVVIMLSNSGESDELLMLLPSLKRLGVPLISFTGHSDSSLASNSNITIDVSVAREACPLGLAPTTSTAAMLAMGDALAISLLSARGFSEQDFARSHPGGKLGKRLLIKVSDIMHSGDQIPAIHPNSSLKEGLLEVSSKGLGMTTIVDDSNRLLGIFTDGDLRRALDKEMDVHNTCMKDVMTRNCKVAYADQLAAEILEEMEKTRINSLPVINDNHELIGALNMHDILQAGVI
ncbi:MAG: KpsF/GutQ family sugar-phosphate isomerase [Pseudomonadota bacterium]